MGYFQFVDFYISVMPNWRAFRGVIVTSFVFISGVSLYMVTQKSDLNRRLFKRFLQLAVCAIGITVSGYIERPNAIVYLGILHFFALSTLLSWPLLKRPKWCLALGSVITLVGMMRDYPKFGANQPFCLTSLEPVCQKTADFVPLFPWFGVLLFGVALAPRAIEMLEKLNLNWQGVFMRGVLFLGRHSLIVYLAHIPILFYSFKVVYLLTR